MRVGWRELTAVSDFSIGLKSGEVKHGEYIVVVKPRGWCNCKSGGIRCEFYRLIDSGAES